MSQDLDKDKPWKDRLEREDYNEEIEEAIDKLNSVLYEHTEDRYLGYREMMEHAGHDPDNIPEEAHKAAIKLNKDGFATVTVAEETGSFGWRYRSGYHEPMILLENEDEEDQLE